MCIMFPSDETEEHSGGGVWLAAWTVWADVPQYSGRKPSFRPHLPHWTDGESVTLKHLRELRVSIHEKYA